MKLASGGDDPIVTEYGSLHEDSLEDIALSMTLTRRDILAMLKREDEIEEWVENLEKCIRSKVEAANEIAADIDARLEALERSRDRLSSLEAPAFEKWMAKVDKAISTLEARMDGRNSGLSLNVRDSFKLLNEHQLQINDLRRKLGVRPGDSLLQALGAQSIEESLGLQGAAEGAMAQVTRPADDDASEWGVEYSPYEKAWHRYHEELLASSDRGKTFPTFEDWSRENGGTEPDARQRAYLQIVPDIEGRDA